MGAAIAVPSSRGMMDALKDFGVGALAGMGYGVSSSIFGSNLLGLAITAAVVGSMVKGARGEIIATMAGFLMVAGMMGGTATAAAANGSGETM